ncbi:hypothetical protein B7R22_09245 [Subtercola boreus]|uniref:DUF6745 domain-containing protein n=1 Tax=Subtercola boreus TaxID=120213 RepID=A0A3E0VWH3_9MICO|nr:hypothetical protein [Subtercola boreus]RFA14414.1 hypothetical protein B7R22_09245 [Subtercola boreus]
MSAQANDPEALLHRWRAAADSTAPIDAIRMRAAVARCYASLGVSLPVHVVLAPSPLAAVRTLRDVPEEVDRQIVEALASTVATLPSGAPSPLPSEPQIPDHQQLWRRLFESARRTVGVADAEEVAWAFMGADRDSHYQCVIRQLEHDTDAADAWFNDFEANTLLGYSCLAEGLDSLGADMGEWNPFRELGWHSYWAWLRRGLVVISERPTALELDEEGRPHCLTGPAMRWMDGWAIWAEHGSWQAPPARPR